MTIAAGYANQKSGDGTGSYTLSLSGAAAGQFALFLTANNAGVSSWGPSSSGWTEIGSAGYGSPSYAQTTLWAKQLTSSDISNGIAFSGVSGVWAVAVMTWSGVNSYSVVSNTALGTPESITSSSLGTAYWVALCLGQYDGSDGYPSVSGTVGVTNRTLSFYDVIGAWIADTNGTSLPSSITESVTPAGSGSCAGLFAVTLVGYSAPNAPTLSGPSQLTAGNAATLTGTYNSTDSENQNAYALEWYTNGTFTGYWNGSSFQSTIAWLSDNVAPGQQWSVTIPASFMSGGNTYAWSMASQEAGANLQGPFAATQSFTVQSAYSAPSAPTLLTPANGAYVDVTQDPPFQGTYNSNDGYAQNYFAFRIKTSSGSYEYWNGTGLQSTQVWVAQTVAPGGTISMTLPVSSFFTNGATYNWSMASQESGGNLQGPFAADFTLNAQVAPRMTFTTPSGTVNVSYPEIGWVTTPAPGANQTAYRIVVCPGAPQSSPPTPYTWDSGWVTSSAQAVSVGTALSNNTQYTAYGMVQETGGEYSNSWATTTWTEVFTQPSTPLVSVVAGSDAAANNMPAMLITVQGQDNYMSEPSSDFETGLGAWGYVTEDGAWVSSGYVNGSDSSGNKQDLILATGEVSVTSPVGSAFAQALSFSSNQGVAQGPTGNTYEQGAITSAWTVEFRYQPSPADITASVTILVWRPEWSCYLGGGYLAFSYNNSSGSHSFSYSTALTAGTSYAIAIVLSGGTFTMYVNGTSVGTASAGTLETPSSSSGLNIGLATSYPGFTGIIDELRVSNTARYTANYTPATSEFSTDSNTGCLYHFDGGLQQSSTPTYNNYPSMAIVCAASAVTAQWGNAYIQGGNTYTLLAQLRAAQSGSATITPSLIWFTSAGTLISTSTGSTVTPTNSGWTAATVTATAPTNAAYCQAQLAISGTAAGQTFYVATAGIFPNWGTTPTWNAGGMVGTESLIILRNDGNYVRWAAPGDPYPMNSVSQEITIYDHEATSNTQYSYSAQLKTSYNNTVSAAGYSNNATLNFTGAWEADPTNLAATGGYVNSSGLAAANAQVTKWNPVQLEQSASHLVLNQTVPNVVANAMGAPGFSCEFQTFSQSVYQALQAVLTSQKTIFVTMAYGVSYYVRFGPSPTGMSTTGMGSQVINSQLQPSTAAGPYYIVTTQAVPQIRPAP